MAKPDNPMSDERPTRPIIAIALGILSLFSLGAMLGASSAALNRENPSVILWVVIVGFAALTVLAVYGAIRNIAFERLSTKTRTGRAQAILGLSFLIGACLSVALPLQEIGSIFVAPEEGANLATFATWRTITALIVIVVLVPLLALVWHRNIDEHEERAFNFGSMMAIYTYVTLTAAWWIAWRGAIAPSPDGYIIFWVTMLVWGLGWMKQKFS